MSGVAEDTSASATTESSSISVDPSAALAPIITTEANATHANATGSGEPDDDDDSMRDESAAAAAITATAAALKASENSKSKGVERRVDGGGAGNDDGEDDDVDGDDDDDDDEDDEPLWTGEHVVANHTWQNRAAHASSTSQHADEHANSRTMRDSPAETAATDDDDDSAANAADDDDVDVTQTLAAHASAWQASSTSMLSDADRSRLASTVAPVTSGHHAIASVIASAHLVASPGGPAGVNAAGSSAASSLSPPNNAALSASDESHAKMLRQRAIAFSLIDKLVAQSDPIITHGMKGVLMSAGVAAHLLSYVSRHDWAAEDAAPDIEELRAARSLTVVRLFSDASPTFREFVQQRLREVLSTLLLLVEVPGARGDFAHFKSILGELLTISAVETVSVFVRNDLLRLLERADEPRVAYTITTMLAAGAVPSEQYRRAFYASVTDVGLFRYLAKSIAMPTQSALRCAHLALLSALLEEFLWTPQSEMLFVGLFKGASADNGAAGALKLGPAAAAAAAAAATTMATDDAAGDNAPGVVQQLANVLSIATQRLGAANEPVAAPSPRSSSAAHALPDDFDDPELLRQRVTLVVGLLGQLADARLASPPPPMAGGAGAGGAGLFGRQAFGLSALGLAGHAERRHGLTRFEAQLKNSLRPCVTHVCAILAQLAARDATRSAPLKLSAFTVQRPLGLYRLALIQALISMLRLDPASMLPRVTAPAWATLTDMFFEYRFNSIYQRLYCDIVGLVIHNNCQASLVALLEQTRLVGRIVERYAINAESEHREDAQRGSLLRVANLLRLRAAAAVAANDPVRLSLANEPRWAAFVDELREVSLADTQRVYETPRRLGGLRSLFGGTIGNALGNALGGAFGALGLGGGMQDARSSYSDAGIDLGSKFAYDLGFTERGGAQQQPLSKKRRKQDKLLSGSESDDGDEADDVPAAVASTRKTTDGNDDDDDDDDNDDNATPTTATSSSRIDEHNESSSQLNASPVDGGAI